MNKLEGEWADPIPVAKANGRLIKAVYVVEGVNSMTFRSVGYAIRHAEGLPPLENDPPPTMVA